MRQESLIYIYIYIYINIGTHAPRKFGEFDLPPGYPVDWQYASNLFQEMQGAPLPSIVVLVGDEAVLL